MRSPARADQLVISTCLLQYGVLIRLLAEAGYTVISTPYAVTFKHTDCAAAVQEVPPIRRM